MGKFYQYQTAVACSFGSLVMGMCNVWPSYTLSLYKAENTTLLHAPLTQLEVSLLGSLPSLGAMLGTAVIGFLLEKLGRKRAGIVISLPFVISWVMIEMTKSSTVILMSRFLAGAAGGAFLVYAPIFISEIAESSIRGTLASGPIFFYCLGVLLSYILGWVQTYRTIIYINIALCVFCLILVTFVTESPVYLLNNDREEDARAAIAHYRDVSVASKIVLEEFSRLKQQLTPAVEMIAVESIDAGEKTGDAEKEKLNMEAIVYQEKAKMSVWRTLWSSRSSRRATIIVTTTITMQVFMGMVTVQVNAKDLFAKAAPDLSSHLCSVLFALVLLVGSSVTAIFADRAGRRLLIIGSSVLVAFCMAGMGLLLQTNIAPTWVTAVLIWLYCFSFMFGAGSVPYVLLTEAFVPEVQSFASIVIVEWVWFLNFLIIALFNFFVSLIGLHGVFYIYACVGAADAIFSYLKVPETKGLTTEEIQDLLAGRKKIDK